MAQFPMGRNTGRNFPVRSPELDDLLISLLEQQQMTTPEENMRQRLESLRRADAGTSPLRMSLYDELYKTGPQQILGPSTDAAGYGLPASVANSAFSGSTGYAKQGPPTPVGLESRLAGRDQFGYGIPASVANSISQSQSPFFQQPSENQNKRAVAAVESAMRAGDYEPYGPTQEQMEQGGLILEGDRRRTANPLQALASRRSRDPQVQQPAMEPVEGGDIAPVGEGVEVSLLERLGNTGIGRAIRNNPELAAMGAQLAGGLISNAAQNRAQRRADRTNQQRTARSNLISALTGGRVRPDVERAQADTGGILSLNTLGQAIRGGGAVMQGELARRVEEDERKRRADLEERAARLSERQAESLDNYRQATLKARAEEFEAQQKLIEEAAQQKIKEQGEEQERQFRGYIKEIDDALGLRKTGGYLDSAQGPKKLYSDMRVLFQQFEEDPNPANITGIIQVYQRMFDPATVRTGDVELLREAEGRLRQAVARLERVTKGGGTISSYTVEDMKKAADDIHALQQKKAQEDVRAYVSRLFNPSEQAVLMGYYDDILSLQELPGSNLDDLRANIAEDLDNL